MPEEAATAVAERPEAVTQPESLTPDSTPESGTPTPEATPEPEVEEVDPDLESYLAEKGLVEPTPTPAANGVTPGQKPETVDPQVEARAQELATETINKVVRQNQERGVALSFGDRARAIREFMAPFTRGEALPTEMDVERIVATFNEHHAQSAQVAAMNFLDSFYGEAESLFPGMMKYRNEHTSPKEFLSVLRDKATSNGYVPERESKSRVKEALIERNKYLENNPDVLRAMLSKASAPKPSGQSSGTPRSMTLDQIDAMPVSQWQAIPLEQRQRLLTQARSR